MTDLITERIVRLRVDEILALPMAERAAAIAVLNRWLVEALDSHQVENPWRMT